MAWIRAATAAAEPSTYAADSVQNSRERRTSPLRAARAAAAGGDAHGPAGRTRPCSGTVIAPSTTARTTRASRHPCASMSAWPTGRKTKEASAPTSVTAVIARRRRRVSGNALASTTNAGSYRTVAMTRPRPANTA